MYKSVASISHMLHQIWEGDHMPHHNFLCDLLVYYTKENAEKETEGLRPNQILGV